MECLKDNVIVNAPPAEVIGWLRHLPENYRNWHPRDHLWIKMEQGETELHNGSVVRTAERLGDVTLNFRFRIIFSQSDQLAEWRALFPHSLFNLHGAFRFDETPHGTSVTASSCYGWRTPLIGKFLDWMTDRFILPRSVIIKHMREEGQFMKMAIEEQCRPDYSVKKPRP